MCVLINLFNFNGKTNLWERKVLSEFHNGGVALNIRDDGRYKKMKEILHEIVNERVMKGITLSWEKTKCMVISKKNSLWFELRIGD